MTRTFQVFFTLALCFQCWQMPVYAADESNSAINEAAVNGIQKLRKIIHQSVSRVMGPRAFKRCRGTRCKKSRAVMSAATTKNFDRTVQCAEAGNARLFGLVTKDTASTPKTISIDAELSLNQCYGLTGSASVDSSGSYRSGVVTASTTVTGEIRGECAPRVPLTLKTNVGFGQRFSPRTRDSGGTINGKIEATCGGAVSSIVVASCEWNNVSLRDIEALKQGCSFASS